MSVHGLAAGNTKKSKIVALNSFKKFLDVENVPLDHIFHCISNDFTGAVFATTVDNFFGSSKIELRTKPF